MTKIYRKLFLFYILILLISGYTLTQSLDTKKQESIITYIANAGVLLSHAGKSILIDGLHRPYKKGYQCLNKSERDRIEKAQSPFNHIDIILITHVHPDHFHTEAVGEHLLHNPAALLISSPQVSDSLTKKFTRIKKIQHQIKTLSPKKNSPTDLHIKGVTISAFNLPHGSPQFHWVQNYGYLINIQGKTFFHPGDADWKPENFSIIQQTVQNIDIAFIPDWYLLYDVGQVIVREYLNPKQIVAIHISTINNQNTAAKIRYEFPESIPFYNPLTSFSFPLIK